MSLWTGLEHPEVVDIWGCGHCSILIVEPIPTDPLYERDSDHVGKHLWDAHRITTPNQSNGSWARVSIDNYRPKLFEV